MVKERVCVFIDGNNLYYSLKYLGVTRIDFQKFLRLLTKDQLLISSFYYNASLNRGINETKYWEQQKFFDELRKIPDFKVILCKLRKHLRKNIGYIFDLKGDDVYWAVDLVSGGDEDFVPAIRKAQKLGKKIINAYFKSSSSTSLKKTCDGSIYMDDLIKKL